MKKNDGLGGNATMCFMEHFKIRPFFFFYVCRYKTYFFNGQIGMLKYNVIPKRKNPQTNCKLDLDVVYFFVIIWHSS